MEFVKEIFFAMLYATLLFRTGVSCLSLWEAQTILDYIFAVIDLMIMTATFVLTYILKRKYEKRLSNSMDLELDEQLDENLEMHPEREAKFHSAEKISNEIKVDRELKEENTQLGGTDPMARRSEIEEEEAVGSDTTAHRSRKDEVVSPATIQYELLPSKLEHSAEHGDLLDFKKILMEQVKEAHKRWLQRAFEGAPTVRCSEKDEIVAPATSHGEMKDSKVEHSAELGSTLGLDASDEGEVEDIVAKEEYKYDTLIFREFEAARFANKQEMTLELNRPWTERPWTGVQGYPGQ